MYLFVIIENYYTDWLSVIVPEKTSETIIVSIKTDIGSALINEINDTESIVKKKN